MINWIVTCIFFFFKPQLFLLIETFGEIGRKNFKKSKILTTIEFHQMLCTKWTTAAVAEVFLNVKVHDICVWYVKKGKNLTTMCWKPEHVGSVLNFLYLRIRLIHFRWHNFTNAISICSREKTLCAVQFVRCWLIYLFIYLRNFN